MKYQTEYSLKYRQSPTNIKQNEVYYKPAKIVTDEPAFQHLKHINNNTFESKIFQANEQDQVEKDEYIRRQIIEKKLQNQLDEEKKKELYFQTLKKQNQQQTTNGITNNIENKEFVLLGPQDKLCTTNVPYNLRKSIFKPQPSQAQPQISHQQQVTQHKPNVNEKKIERVQFEHQEAAGLSSISNNNDFIVLGPDNKQTFINSIAYKLKKQEQNLVTPRQQNNNKTKIIKKKDIKNAPSVKIDTGVQHERIISNESKNLLRNVPMTEYQKSFIWKEVNDADKNKIRSIKSAPSSNVSTAPLTNANLDLNKINEPKPAPVVNLVSKSLDNLNHSLVSNEQQTNVQPKKRDVFNRVSEYRSSFGNYINQLRHLNNEKELVDHQNKKKQINEDEITIKKNIQFAANPQQLFMPHGKLRRWKSEYASKFQAWDGETFKKERGDEEELLRANKQNNNEIEKQQWYKNIIELRQKANEYKQRAHGINFSTEHVGQLVGKNLDLWDIELENKANDLKLNEKTQINPSQHQQPQTQQQQQTLSKEKKHKQKSKQQHNKRSLSAEPKYIHSCSTQTLENSYQDEQQQVSLSEVEEEDNKKEELLSEILKLNKKNKVVPVKRLVDNLDSIQIKKNMEWDDEESLNNNYQVNAYGYNNNINYNEQQENFNLKPNLTLIDKHASLLEDAKQKAYKERASNKQKFFNTELKLPREAFYDHTNEINHYYNDKQQQNNNFKNRLTTENVKHQNEQNQLSTMNENFAKTYLKPTFFEDKDIDSLSQLSNRSLASSSSLLDRAKSNRDKFWGDQQTTVKRSSKTISKHYKN